MSTNTNVTLINSIMFIKKNRNDVIATDEQAMEEPDKGEVFGKRATVSSKFRQRFPAKRSGGKAKLIASLQKCKSSTRIVHKQIIREINQRFI